MKKVVVASLLACAAIVSGRTSAFAQAPAAAPCQMPDAEYQPYNNAITQKTPQTMAPAIEAYLTAFPQSACPGTKLGALVTLMAAYSQFDTAKTLDAADRVLQLDPNNLRALVFETYLRKSSADSLADPAKQAALDAAAGFAQKGLVVTKPADMTDADFKTLQGTAFPIFYSAIATAALNKKDDPTAIDAFKKELASVPVDQTTKPGPYLQDTYFLARAYLESTPPDLLDCAFYATRFTDYAPEPFKTQYAPTAKYCYKKYHGGDDGYDAVVAAAQANLNPPDGFQASIKPAPTPQERIHTIIASTPDLATLAIDDKETIFQNGSPDDAAKVWDTVKGKSVEIPDALVIESSPTVLKVAISSDAVQSKTADFTFNMAPLEEGTTAAQKAAAKKKAEQIATLTAVGSKVTLTGTYDSFTPNPIMITMSDGAVILPKATPAARTPVHHTPAHK